jgi:hypothetical protein
MTPTIEGNKLIAEFTGEWELRKPDLSRAYKGEHYLHKDRQYIINDIELKYHTSWDWLMPVVEKIRTLNPDKGKLWFEWEILFCHCRIWSNTKLEWKNNSGTTINAVFESVTQFIQWYNQQNQKQ